MTFSGKHMVQNALVAIAIGVAVQTSAYADRPVSALKQVDWANRDYGRRHLRLKNGRYTLRRYLSKRNRAELECRHTSETARLVRVHFGDMTGDGKHEALVEIATHKNMCVAGVRNRSVFVVFSEDKNGVKEIGRFDTPPITSFRLEKGTVYIQRSEAHVDGWATCNDVWHFSGGRMKRRESRCVLHAKSAP